MNLKAQLKLYLESRDMTASQLARLSGVPKQSISDWLSGTNPRDVRMLKRVADVFGITLDHLLFGNGINSASTPTPIENIISHSDWYGGLFEVKFRKIKNT